MMLPRMAAASEAAELEDVELDVPVEPVVLAGDVMPVVPRPQEAKMTMQPRMAGKKYFFINLILIN